MGVGRTQLQLVTLLGTLANESAISLAIHPNGSILVAGPTDSKTFPGTAGRYQPANAGGYDLFVAVLYASGNLQCATYLGGSGDELPWSAAPMGTFSRLLLDGAGDPLVMETTASTDLRTTPNALQTTYGGGAHDIFVARLDLALRQATYVTYGGGAGDDRVFGAALGLGGRVKLVGNTSSANYPVTDGLTYRGGSCSALVPGDAVVTTLDLRQPGRQGCGGPPTSVARAATSRWT